MPARAAATKQPASIAASASTHPQTSSFVSATGCVQFFNRSGHAQRRTPTSGRLLQVQLEDRSSLRAEYSSRSRSATLSAAFGPKSRQLASRGMLGVLAAVREHSHLSVVFLSAEQHSMQWSSRSVLKL